MTDYKPSMYNLCYCVNSKDFAWVLANTYSGCIMKASDGLKNLVVNFDPERFEALKEENPEMYRNLLVNSFIVDKSLDELKRLRIKFQQEKLHNNRLQYTICPTTNCNLACIYCYETPRPQNMTPEVVEKIKRFTDARIASFSSFSVNWYGGEPLMVKWVIEELSRHFIEICDKNNIGYSARLISNGTLLDKETVDMLVRSRVGSAQISIDGPEDVHNARRFYRGGQKPSFKDIVEGLANCKGKIPAEIRINVDRTNIDRYKEFVDYLFDRGLLGPESGNTVSLGVVKLWSDDVGVKRSDLLSLVEFNVHSEELKRYLFEQGITENNPWAFMPSTPCISVNTSYFVILPTGDLKKCWIHPTIDGTEVGTLDKELDLSLPIAVEWTAYDPTLDPKCSTCVYLPICAGGCPYENMTKPEMKEQICAYHKHCVDVNVLKAINMLDDYLTQEEVFVTTVTENEIQS